jgi:hypothetical protein
VKKIPIAFLAILYLAITSGVVMNFHYCMGKMASVNLGAGKQELCGKCGMKEKAGCCESEQKVVKLGDEHQLPKKSASLEDFNSSLIHSFLIAIQAFPNTKRNAPPYYHSPPDLEAHAIYLENCVFRI